VERGALASRATGSVELPAVKQERTSDPEDGDLVLESIRRYLLLMENRHSNANG
jgi:hypothetical protein